MRVAVVVKRQRISAEHGREFLEQLATLNFRIDAPPAIAAFSLACWPRLRVHQLTGLRSWRIVDLAQASHRFRWRRSDTDLKIAALAEGLQIL